MQTIVFKLSPSKIDGKKWNVKSGKISIDFGQQGAYDYTLHEPQDADERRYAYIQRHKKLEEKYWSREGIYSKSFWSRFLLWEERNIFEAIAKIEQMYNIHITFTQNTIKRHQKLLKKISQQNE